MPGPTLSAAHAGQQLFDQRIARLADGDRHRDGHAALACRTIGCTHHRVGCLVHIGIGHDDHVVLGPAESLHALILRGARVIDVFGDGRGADEADRGHFRVVQQGVHRLLVAIHHIEYAVGQARLFQQLGQDQ